ncbi:MAG TPA: hypothetical protein VFN28_12825 [Amaricoccus sp.]|nr:hypothetical protein [Amaricoccus sp.]
MRGRYTVEGGRQTRRRMVAERRTRGFWKGFLTGLVLAAAGLLALAWFYPPRPLLPPEVDPRALAAPAAPGQPDGVTAPAPAEPRSAPREAPRSAPRSGPAPVPATPQIGDAPASEAVPTPAN